jgi:uncharacterized protein with HEPN domain
MLAAIEGIEAAVAGKSLADFKNEWLLKHGVQRGIEILSEASRHLPPTLRARHPAVPWQQIAGIGNVLRHEYHRIADQIIWNVVTEYLPALKAAVVEMQSQIDE